MLVLALCLVISSFIHVLLPLRNSSTSNTLTFQFFYSANEKADCWVVVGVGTLIKANSKTRQQWTRMCFFDSYLTFHIQHFSLSMCNAFNDVCLCFDGKLAHRENALFLQLLCGPNAEFMFRQRTPHGTRLLRPQIFRYVTSLLVELAQILLLRLVNDGQDARYRLPHHAATQTTQNAAPTAIWLLHSTPWKKHCVAVALLVRKQC